MGKHEAITSRRYSPEKLPDALLALFQEFSRTSFDVRQEAVQAGAEVFKAAAEAATPRDTGKMAASWKIKSKCKNVRYVGNTRVATGPVRRKTKDGSKGEARTGVPLINVLEYAENSPHAGFVRRCFDSAEPQIFAAIKETIKNGGKR